MRPSCVLPPVEFWRGVRPRRRGLSLDKRGEASGLSHLSNEPASASAEKTEQGNPPYRIVLPDGSVKHLQSVGQPDIGASGDLEFVGTVMDITERRHAEEALRNAQAELTRVARLTTMGELAASIAHEINQPLTAVVTSGNAGLRWLN